MIKSDKISKRVFLECFKLRRERNGDLCVDCNAIARRWSRMSTSARNKTDFSEVNAGLFSVHFSALSVGEKGLT